MDSSLVRRSVAGHSESPVAVTAFEFFLSSVQGHVIPKIVQEAERGAADFADVWPLFRMNPFVFFHSPTDRKHQRAMAA